MQTASCQILPCPHEHILGVILAEFVAFQGIICSFHKIVQERLITNLLHILLHLTIIDSLSQPLQSLGHQHILSVASLSLPDHACSNHSLKHLFSQSFFNLNVKPALSDPQRLLLSLNSRPFCESSFYKRNQVLLCLSSDLISDLLFLGTVPSKTCKNSLLVQMKDFQRY